MYGLLVQRRCWYGLRNDVACVTVVLAGLSLL